MLNLTYSKASRENSTHIRQKSKQCMEAWLDHRYSTGFPANAESRLAWLAFQSARRRLPVSSQPSAVFGRPTAQSFKYAPLTSSGGPKRPNKVVEAPCGIVLSAKNVRNINAPMADWCLVRLVAMTPGSTAQETMRRSDGRSLNLSATDLAKRRFASLLWPYAPQLL